MQMHLWDLTTGKERMKLELPGRRLDLIKFTVKAQLVPPKNAPPPLPARGRGAARGATPSPAGRGAAGGR